MTRQLYDIEISITLLAPYLVHGSDPGRYGLDAVLLRDHNHTPILPGTLIAGRIIEAWNSLPKELDNKPSAAQWFGNGASDNGNDAQNNQRARLLLDDLRLVSINNNHPTEQLTDNARVAIDDNTGAVQTGALLITEQIAQAGAKLKFTGTWRVWAQADEIDELIKQLRAALWLQTQLGAYRGVGFGRVHEVSIQNKKSQPNNQPNDQFKLSANTTRYRLALRSTQAICVGSHSRRGNVFVSDSIITGNTILGAMATMLANQHGQNSLDNINTPLAQHFSKIRCTHALPTTIDQPRPLPLPQSLISMGSTIYNAWQYQVPPKNLSDTPAFQTDWKATDYENAAEKYNNTLAHLPRYLRVRTAIDEQGTAKEGSLFAYECVTTPLDENKQPKTEWRFDLDLSQIPADEREAVRQEVEALLCNGLFPIGKTDATMQVVNITQPPNQAHLDNLKNGNMIALVLVSDALLFTTETVASKPDCDLSKIYCDALNTLPNKANGLELSHFFATQKMVGGSYLHNRYRKDKPYQPWILTEAGSVFVFTINNAAQAQATLTDWLNNGLGLPEAVQKNYGKTWQDHPYLPQTGYGEVALSTQSDELPTQQKEKA